MSHKKIFRNNVERVVMPKKKLTVFDERLRDLHFHVKTNTPVAKALKLVKQSADIRRAKTILAFDDDKEQSSVDFKKELSLLRGAVSSMLGSGKSYHFDLSCIAAVSTTTGQVVQLNPNNSGNVRQLQAFGNASNQPEWSTLATLFDEYKTMGMSVNYWPVNTTSRYIFTAGVFTGYVPTTPFALLFDDDNSNASPTNSLAALGTFSDRGALFQMFSPDLVFSHSFMRPGRDVDYLWDDVQSPGSTNGGLGGLQFTSDGASGLTTAVVPFGTFKVTWHMKFRVRI